MSTWTSCAARVAPGDVDEFVERLPDGYETVVGERGMKLSGGQRQRVAIAQAMAKGAKVLVLDEATSLLDSESETLGQEALWHLMEGTTALVVAHRLVTIARLDRIVVLTAVVWSSRAPTPSCSPPAVPASTVVCGRTSRAASWPRDVPPALPWDAGRYRLRASCSAGRIVSAGVRRGRWTLNVVDQPGVSPISTKPSWASATDLAMAKPSPVPGTPISVEEASR